MNTKRGFVVAVLSAWLACSGTPALAQYPVSKQVFTCEDKSSKALSSFVHAKAHCITGCERRARQGKNPFSDCDPPAFGGETAVCIFDAQKGAEGKATLGILKGCHAGCPVCYGGGDCSAASTSHVSFSENLFDSLHPLIYCATGGNASQNTCRERVADAFSVYAKRHTKCYRSCYLGAQKGKVAAASCAPPSPTDPKTVECLDLANTKAATVIDKGCFRPRADAPPCYDGTTAPSSGANWALLARAAFDTTIPMSFCGSPSGAFVE